MCAELRIVSFSEGIKPRKNKNKMNDKTLTVKIANVYGNRVIYPVCETAKKFAAMLGTKTLTMEAKRHIEGLGYSFALQQETL